MLTNFSNNCLEYCSMWYVVLSLIFILLELYIVISKLKYCEFNYRVWNNTGRRSLGRRCAIFFHRNIRMRWRIRGIINKKPPIKGALIGMRSRIVRRKILIIILFIASCVLVCYCSLLLKIIVCIIWGILLLFGEYIPLWGMRRYLPGLSNLHLIFPRLIASISAAWLTVAFSSDLYKAFFDMEWSLLSAFLIVGIIFLFVLYEITKTSPKIHIVRRILRTIELILISYIISFGIGLIIISFSGERMLERSGILPSFYRDNVIIKHNNSLLLDTSSIRDSSLLLVKMIGDYTYDIEGLRDDPNKAINAINYFAREPYDRHILDKIVYLRDSMSNGNINQIDSLTPEILGKFLLKSMAESHSGYTVIKCGVYTSPLDTRRLK